MTKPQLFVVVGVLAIAVSYGKFRRRRPGISFVFSEVFTQVSYVAPNFWRHKSFSNICSGQGQRPKIFGVPGMPHL